MTHGHHFVKYSVCYINNLCQSGIVQPGIVIKGIRGQTAQQLIDILQKMKVGLGINQYINEFECSQLIIEMIFILFNKEYVALFDEQRLIMDNMQAMTAFNNDQFIKLMTMFYVIIFRIAVVNGQFIWRGREIFFCCKTHK